MGATNPNDWPTPGRPEPQNTKDTKPLVANFDDLDSRDRAKVRLYLMDLERLYAKTARLGGFHDDRLHLLGGLIGAVLQGRDCTVVGQIAYNNNIQIHDTG